MTSELTVRRDYLAAHRRMIIGRSIAASMSGMVPVPIFEEWLTSTIKRGTIRRIASGRSVDINHAAARAIADGTTAPPEWTEMAGTTLLYKIVSRAWRKAIILYLATRRTQVAAHNFMIATMFDHYCARLHVGLGLDGDTGAELRELMSSAIEQTPGGLGKDVFRRGALTAAKATVQAPVELLDIASGGALRRLLKGGGDEVEAIEEVDSALDQQLRSGKSFLGKSVAAVELQLSSEANPYLESLISVFEDLWRSRDPAK